MRIGPAATVVALLLSGCGTTAVQARGDTGPSSASAALHRLGPLGSSLGMHPGRATGTPPPDPSDAPRMSCAQVNASRGVEFARISGRVAPLPADNPVARDGTIVQPGNLPLGHFAIGVDDGSGSLCAVAWVLPRPAPAVGAPVALIVQIVPSSGGGHWLGPVDLPY